jgi:CheY-like chemotaxis protein
LRILVVEDEQIIAEDLAQELSQLGHEVVGIAMSGEEAVAIAEGFMPEIVLMDIQLAGAMKGTEAAQIVEQRTGATVVFVTAYPNMYVREERHAGGRGLCIHKPVSRAHLTSALQMAAEMRGGSARSS